MTYSHFDCAAQNRVPWSFGAKTGPKRPFNQRQIWAIRFSLIASSAFEIARCLIWRLIASFEAVISSS